MRKGLVAIWGFTVILGLAGYTFAQQAPQNPCAGQQMMQQGQMGRQGQMGSQGQMGPGGGMMGPGMMGQTGQQGQIGPGMGMGPGMMGGGMGMMGMGPGMGMGMMGPMMGSPEIMGTMISIHGEIQSVMGQMMQKYGRAMESATPELPQQMQKEMMERIGEILTKHGAALKERAKAAGK